uniref:Uncharacterized protein n=1 Tax=Glossina austeni TaxID=7395 RepID=A0A1A9VER9_GLOAU
MQDSGTKQDDETPFLASMSVSSNLLHKFDRFVVGSSVICFGVRSVLTPFNMLLSTIPTTSTRCEDYTHLLMKIQQQWTQFKKRADCNLQFLGKKKRRSVSSRTVGRHCTILQQHHTSDLKGSVE